MGLGLGEIYRGRIWAFWRCFSVMGKLYYRFLVGNGWEKVLMETAGHQSPRFRRERERVAWEESKHLYLIFFFFLTLQLWCIVLYFYYYYCAADSSVEYLLSSVFVCFTNF